MLRDYAGASGNQSCCFKVCAPTSPSPNKSVVRQADTVPVPITLSNLADCFVQACLDEAHILLAWRSPMHALPAKFRPLVFCQSDSAPFSHIQLKSTLSVALKWLR